MPVKHPEKKSNEKEVKPAPNPSKFELFTFDITVSYMQRQKMGVLFSRVEHVLFFKYRGHAPSGEEVGPSAVSIC